MAILQAVLQKFSRKPATPTETPALNDLSSTIKRYAPLFALQDKRQLIEVISERTGDTFQSMILAVDLANRTLELDELFPQPADFIYQPGDRFTVRHHQHGQLLTFTSTLESLTLSLGTPVYTLTLPEQVGYRQRRTSTRISLSRQHPLTVRLQSPRRTPWYATANNLSIGGMRLVVGGNILDQLSRNVLLPRCEFSFHSDFKVQCQARVKAFRFLRRPYRHTEISVEFKDLAPQHQLQLKQLVESLESSPQAA
ncbi:hypothetical protein HBA55_26980 [Pseudomaricurvus alkylphenolicus]|jgi:c-di-GMP-binding flagellar brake protein YcgR|uniref:flagellar brake protein n=1 Tax=Pseudomaricurvus alkylphenolicus TaxID=1306991 RepID=UPI001423E61E|nr:flagellar brake protein [Pseudomaricurvus alkylphenolicus]NIB43281.1 hypothetical protein [Pseudomaricurvus alkylphenolicus]